MSSEDADEATATEVPQSDTTVFTPRGQYPSILIYGDAPNTAPILTCGDAPNTISQKLSETRVVLEFPSHDCSVATGRDHCRPVRTDYDTRYGKGLVSKGLAHQATIQHVPNLHVAHFSSSDDCFAVRAERQAADATGPIPVQLCDDFTTPDVPDMNHTILAPRGQ